MNGERFWNKWSWSRGWEWFRGLKHAILGFRVDDLCFLVVEVIEARHINKDGYEVVGQPRGHRHRHREYPKRRLDRGR